MALRVAIDGSRGLFRVSRPGRDALTAGDFDLIFREYAAGLVPGLVGQVDRPATIALPTPGQHPIVFLQLNASASPSVDQSTPYDYIDADKTFLRLEGKGICRYYIFGNRQF